MFIDSTPVVRNKDMYTLRAEAQKQFRESSRLAITAVALAAILLVTGVLAFSGTLGLGALSSNLIGAASFVGTVVGIVVWARQSDKSVTIDSNYQNSINNARDSLEKLDSIKGLSEHAKLGFNVIDLPYIMTHEQINRAIELIENYQKDQNQEELQQGWSNLRQEILNPSDVNG